MWKYSAPQVAGRDEPFRSEIREHLKGRTEALEELAVELLVCGLSVRDIEDAFRDETGRLLLSKTAVSEIRERLWADYQEFAPRDLGEYEIAYLFVDGIAERIRPGQKREPVLAAWGFTASGAKVLLHLMAGSKEDPETVSASSRTCAAAGSGLARHCPRSRRRSGEGLRGRAAERDRLLHGRLRSCNRASENADHSPPRHQASSSQTDRAHFFHRLLADPI